MRLVTQPVGRKLDLRSSEGVRKWSMRLSHSENKVLVKDVKFASFDEAAAADGADDDDDEGTLNGEEKWSASLVADFDDHR